MEQQLVVFDLGSEHFGVDIGAVDGIIKMQDITKVPKAPRFVEGVTNLRGSVLPIVDLRRRLNLDLNDNTHETRIVIVNMEQAKIGMIVDAVSEVLTVQDDVIEPPPPMVSTVDTLFITGIAKVDSRLVILLDLSRVLSMEEKNSLQVM